MNYRDPKVINWINEIRAKDGRKPLKRIAYAKWVGDRFGLNHRDVLHPRSQNCPIARSLGNYSVNAVYYRKLDEPWHRDETQKLPEHVGNWIGEFDANS